MKKSMEKSVFCICVKKRISPGRDTARKTGRNIMNTDLLFTTKTMRDTQSKLKK